MRGRIHWVLASLALTIPGVSRADPPIAEAAASPSEVLVGQSVEFSSAGTMDPDNGPGPMTFSWDFGDGGSSTQPDPSHSYSSLGLKTVTLTVSDGLEVGQTELEVAVVAPPTATAPASSATLLLRDQDAELWVVNSDSGSVSVVDVATDYAVTEIPVGASPRTLSISPDGDRVYVVCQGSGELWVIDAASRQVLDSAPVGHRPYGVAASPADGRVLVTSPGEGRILLVDASTLAVSQVFHTGGTPRAVAITADGARAFVSDFLTRGDVGRVWALDLTVPALFPPIDLAVDPGPNTSASGEGYPNLLGTLTIDPHGTAAWVGGLKSNTDRGSYVSGELMHPHNRLRGLFTPIDVQTRQESVLNRIDVDDADQVSGIAFSPLGRYVYVTHPGSGRFTVYDLPTAEMIQTGDGPTIPPRNRLDVGHVPTGLVVSGDATRLHVTNALSRDVMTFDLADPLAPVLLTTQVVTSEPLSPEVINGKRLFHRSVDPVHSDTNYIACASCHPDGGHDGRTWDFTEFGEGLRNTIDLRGRAGMAHGPVHWTANFDEIQDFENDIVNGFGGEGLAQDGLPPHPPLGPDKNAGRSQDLDDLATYVGTLSIFPPSPHRTADGSLPPAALRGRDLFFDLGVGCAECHAPPRFTDSELTPDVADFVRHDVGTIGAGSGQGLGQALVGFDTPTVLGVWATSPYLHDGSAPGLRDVLERNLQDLHGVTSHLSDDDLDDLVAYLLCLDGSADEIPDDPGGTGTGGGTGGTTGSTSAGTGTGTGSSTTATSTTTTVTTSGDVTSGNGSTGSDAGTTGSGGEASADAGCGCRSTSPRDGWAGLWILVLATRRRRRHERRHRRIGMRSGLAGLVGSLCLLGGCGWPGRCGRVKSLPEPREILMLGDSIFDSNGRCSDVADYLSLDLGAQVVDRSRGGLWLDHGSEPDIPSFYEPDPWKWVIVGGGGNDLASCKCQCDRVLDNLVTPDANAGVMVDLVAQARADGAKVAVFGYYRPTGESDYGGRIPDLEDLVERYAKLADRVDHVWFVDGRQVLTPEADPDAYREDGTHPTPEGARRLATAFHELIRDGDRS